MKFEHTKEERTAIRMLFAMGIPLEIRIFPEASCKEIWITLGPTYKTFDQSWFARYRFRRKQK